jgi:hypothetical protein
MTTADGEATGCHLLQALAMELNLRQTEVSLKPFNLLLRSLLAAAAVVVAGFCLTIVAFDNPRTETRTQVPPPPPPLLLVQLAQLRPPWEKAAA